MVNKEIIPLRLDIPDESIVFLKTPVESHIICLWETLSFFISFLFTAVALVTEYKYYSSLQAANV